MRPLIPGNPPTVTSVTESPKRKRAPVRSVSGVTLTITPPSPEVKVQLVRSLAETLNEPPMIVLISAAVTSAHAPLLASALGRLKPLGSSIGGKVGMGGMVNPGGTVGIGGMLGMVIEVQLAISTVAPMTDSASLRMTIIRSSLLPSGEL